MRTTIPETGVSRHLGRPLEACRPGNLGEWLGYYRRLREYGERKIDRDALLRHILEFR